MTGEGNDLHSTAIRNLTSFGLSEYAARTLVALTRIGGGSARDVSEASSVPRTRVYDAVAELSERGFVTVRESHPKVFDPVAPRRIRRAFYREYVYRQVLVEWALLSLAPADTSGDAHGVGTTTGRDAVEEHVQAAVADADRRVTYVAIGDLPSDRTLGALADAADRDVTVSVVGVGDVEGDEIRTAIPAATVVVPGPATPPNGWTRLLILDDTTVLLGMRTDGTDGSTEMALFSEQPDDEVAELFEQLVDTWLADDS